MPAQGQQASVRKVQRNIAHGDEIWKAYVSSEGRLAKQWPETWGFLAAEYAKATRLPETRHPPVTLTNAQLRESIEKRLANPRRYGRNRIPPAVTLKLPSVGGQSVTSKSQNPPAKPSPMPFPLTRAREIGWRGSDVNCLLEKYGPYVKPMGGLAKQLGWPPECF